MRNIVSTDEFLQTKPTDEDFTEPSFIKPKFNSNKKQTMPYQSGSWGPEAQERSKRRLDYFHAHNQQKYQLNKDKENGKAAFYYKLHREEILEKKVVDYSKKSSFKNNLY